MSQPLILLHAEALRMTHPVFAVAPAGTPVIFAWDDSYWRAANYSLKRLVFIYETLCEMPIEILQGTMEEIVHAYAPTTIYVPATHNPLLRSTITALGSIAPLQWINDEPFVNVQFKADLRRFFPYWNKAQQNAFLKNGGGHD